MCLSAEGVGDRKGWLTVGSVFCWLLIYVMKNMNFNEGYKSP